MHIMTREMNHTFAQCILINLKPFWTQEDIKKHTHTSPTNCTEWVSRGVSSHFCIMSHINSLYLFSETSACKSILGSSHIPARSPVKRKRTHTSKFMSNSSHHNSSFTFAWPLSEQVHRLFSGSLTLHYTGQCLFHTWSLFNRLSGIILYPQLRVPVLWQTQITAASRHC